MALALSARDVGMQPRMKGTEHAPFPHSAHRYSRMLSCTRICSFSMSFRAKDLPHCSHAWLFTPGSTGFSHGAAHERGTHPYALGWAQGLPRLGGGTLCPVKAQTPLEAQR